MKQVIVFLMVLFSLKSFSDYNFPMKNKYVSTIIGSSTMLTKGIPENVPTKVYSLDLEEKDVPKNLWYEDGFKFSFSQQKGEAPLIFVISGTGAKYDSKRTTFFKNIFYNAGYHVLTVSSAYSTNFIINASEQKVPGVLYEDGKDTFNVMKIMLEKVKATNKNLEISDIYLTGYSMGGTHSAVVSFIDSNEKYFNFKRVFLINPAIDLYSSAIALDNMLTKNINSRKGVAGIVDNLLEIVGENMSTASLDVDIESLYKLFRNKALSNKEMETLIGLAFNFASVDLNYISDLLTDSKIYSKKAPTKYEDMSPIYKRINFATFNDYLERIAYPHYKNFFMKDIKFENLTKLADLELYRDYLENAENIAVVTNEDDFILNKNNLNFIRNVFQDRNIIYPYGGHCGNMFYQQNVDKMLEYLKSGELNDKL